MIILQIFLLSGTFYDIIRKNTSGEKTAMDSTRLKYFISAAQSLNFSDVARNYYVSQPTISHQIGLLEQELGVELFTRQGTKLHLTGEGEFFFPIARKIVDEIHDASLDITRYKQGKMGKVSVFVAETCRSSYQRCIATFSKQNSGVLVDAIIASSPTQAETIISGDYDICFTLERLVKSSGRFDCLFTHQDRLCLVLPDYIPVPEYFEDFSFLSDVPFIGLHPANSTFLHHDTQLIFQKNDFTPNLVNRYNRMDEVLLSVDAGLGFAILPNSIINYNTSRRIKSLQLEDGVYCVDYVAAWRKENRSGAAELFVKTIKNVYSA
jgi:DNA-binding transcriptional LysR family regulator